MTALSEDQRQALLADLGGLRRFCLSLTGQAADADDLLQATVEKLLEKGMPADAHVAKWAYLTQGATTTKAVQIFCTAVIWLIGNVDEVLTTRNVVKW